MFHEARIYDLTFGDKSIRVLGLHIRNQLHKTLKAQLFFQTFKIPLFHRFGLKCKCRIISYLDDEFDSTNT